MSTEEALNQIKNVFEDGVATINGRDYKFTPMTHGERVKVFAFFSSIQHQIQGGDFSFLDDAKYKEVEKVIVSRVTYEDMQLSKIANHWDNFAEDYLIFVTTALGVVSYPFLKQGRSGR